jgi:ABC-type multidrug transport system permease subunit
LIQGEHRFWAFLALFVVLLIFLPSVGFCGFPSSRWPSWVFLGFLGLLVVLHGVLDLRFKLCIFVVNGLIKGEIEKSSGQFLGLIVMSHWLGEVWIRIQNIFVILPLFLYRVENRICLSRGVQVAGAAWHAVMRIMQE